MLGDVGIAFRFTGANRAISLMQRLKREYGALSSEVDRGGALIGKSFSGMAGTLKTAAVGALATVGALTAAAVAIPYQLAKTRVKLEEHQSQLMGLGMGRGAIDLIERESMRVSDRYAKITTEGLTDANYQIKSAWSKLNPMEVADITNWSAMGSRVTKMAGEMAGAQYLAGFRGALEEFMPELTPQEFTKRLWAQTRQVVEKFATTGPDLSQAMQGSAGVLASMGWKMKEMLGTWATLTDAKISGSEVATFLTNMATKSGSGFAKVIEKVEGFGPALQKAMGEKNYEDIVKREGAIGGYLFGKDPARFFTLLKQAKDMAKAKGQDWQEIAASAFGQETLRALPIILQKSAGLAKTYADTAKASFAEVEQRNRAMNQTISGGMDLLSQRWGNLWKTVGRSATGPVGAVFDGIGQQLMKVRELYSALFSDSSPLEKIVWLRKTGGEPLVQMYRDLKGIRTNTDAFGEAFSKSFMGNLGTAEVSLSRIVDLLGKADAEKWRSIGDSFGKIASDPLKAFAENLAKIDKLLGNLMLAKEGIGNMFGGTVSNLSKILPRTPSQAIFDWGRDTLVERGLRTRTDLGGMISPHQMNPKTPLLHASPGVSEGQHSGPMMRPEPMMLRGGMMPAHGPVKQERPVVNVAAPKVDVSVTLDSKEIIAAVRADVQREAARHRLGAGDVWDGALW